MVGGYRRDPMGSRRWRPIVALESAAHTAHPSDRSHKLAKITQTGTRSHKGITGRGRGHLQITITMGSRSCRPIKSHLRCSHITQITQTGTGSYKGITGSQRTMITKLPANSEHWTRKYWPSCSGSQSSKSLPLS